MFSFEHFHSDRKLHQSYSKNINFRRPPWSLLSALWLLVPMGWILSFWFILNSLGWKDTVRENYCNIYPCHQLTASLVKDVLDPTCDDSTTLIVPNPTTASICTTQSWRGPIWILWIGEWRCRIDGHFTVHGNILHLYNVEGVNLVNGKEIYSPENLVRILSLTSKKHLKAATQ